MMELYIEHVHKSFLADTQDHKLSILKDDGVYRHIKVSKPNEGSYHYYITTWPWHLCISGDMGTWVFSRV